jgi:hypothetical protein
VLISGRVVAIPLGFPTEGPKRYREKSNAWRDSPYQVEADSFRTKHSPSKVSQSDPAKPNSNFKLLVTFCKFLLATTLSLARALIMTKGLI